eukprot:3157506-Rhodomonas_salina.2
MNLGERKAGQASAYTIFNNFQPLEGELRMEQIEAEMRPRCMEQIEAEMRYAYASVLLMQSDSVVCIADA